MKQKDKSIVIETIKKKSQKMKAKNIQIVKIVAKSLQISHPLNKHSSQLKL